MLEKPEKIIKLQLTAAGVEKQELLATAPEDAVVIKLHARAPEWQCQLKLWDLHGRHPQLLEPKRIDRESAEWQLEPRIEKLDGLTLTWWVRLAATVSTTFELRLQVFQGEAPLPEGTFSYSGPLDESEFEERNGRFHFKVLRD